MYVFFSFSLFSILVFYKQVIPVGAFWVPIPDEDAPGGTQVRFSLRVVTVSMRSMCAFIRSQV